MSKFTFNSHDDVIEVAEVAIMQTSPTRELPGVLDGVRFRAVGRQVIEREASGALLLSCPVKAGVVVFRIIGNDDHPSSASAAGRPQVAEEFPARPNVEFLGLAPKEEPAIAQPDCPEIADAPPRRVVEQDRILGLRWHSHPAVRTVLLEMHFVPDPKVNRYVEA